MREANAAAFANQLQEFGPLPGKNRLAVRDMGAIRCGMRNSA
jgi:hypothetical protein